jgi:predicted nuclease of predicted toxin-antitoxin system
MRFLVDAQLPRRLARRLTEAGHDAIHTLDLPKGNRTTDSEINEVSIAEQRVVITKDDEFVSRFLFTQGPFKLLLVSTGNIDNRTLETIFVPRIPKIATIFETHLFIELTRSGVVVRV